MEENRTDKISSVSPRGDSFLLRDFLSMCLSNWYWVVVSVILCLAVGVLVIMRSPRIYSRSATILIKETLTRRQSNDLESILSGGGMSQMNSKLSNEVVAFTSPDIMREVVKRLNLQVDIYQRGTFRNTLLYGATAPYSISFLDGPSCSFLLESKDSTLLISDVRYSKDGKSIEDENRYSCAPGDTLVTQFGIFTIAANPLCTAQYIEALEVHHGGLESTTRRYTGMLKAAAVDMKNYSDLLELSINDQSVERADDILNTVISVYNENWVADRNQIALSTSVFINDRLATIERELGNVDEDISSYRSRNLLPDVAEVSSMYMRRSEEIDKQIQELNNQLYMVKYVRNYLSGKVADNQLIPVSGVISNPAITTQINNYNTVMLERNNLVAGSSEQNPIVRDMDNSLRAMRASIIESIDSQIETLSQQIIHVKDEGVKTSSRLADNPNQAKHLLGVERQQSVKQTLYLFLLQKREENELSQAFTAYNTRVVTKPTGPVEPTSPQNRRILLIAFMLGLCIPVGVMYLTMTLNTKIRGRRDLEGVSLPFLGEIPMHYVRRKGLFRKAQGVAQEFIVKPSKRDAINEAFRVLRTNLEFVTKSDEGKVIAITSFNPGSGKTFISSNLAMALAIKDKKVIVVDGDLRHLSMSKFAGNPKKGLSDYLVGDVADYRDVIVSNAEVPNLKILPVGTIPPNPTELVGLDKFADLVAELRKDYDYVFIDCPPVDIVADTQIIESVVDRTIFIVRAGLLDRTMIPELEGMSERQQIKQTAIVLNGTEPVGHYYGYRYGYSYGYRYGYHYGYGSNKGGDYYSNN